MKKYPLISICIPSYNSGKYIKATLESLLKQSYEYIEIIVVDNNSSDNTYEIVEDIASRDKRIKHYKNSTNLGYVKNIQKTIEKASSEYIAIYHSDDIYDSKIIEKQIMILLENNDYAAVFTTLYEFHKTPLKRRRINFYKRLMSQPFYNKKFNTFEITTKNMRSVFFTYGNIFVCPSFMTKKSIYLSTGGFTDNYPSNEDLELWIKYLKSNYTLGIINEPLIYYRRSDSQGSAFWSKQSELPLYFKVIEDMLISDNDSLDQSQLLNYKKNKSIEYLYAAINALKANKIDLSKHHIRNSINCYKFKAGSLKSIFQKYPFFFKVYRDIVAIIKRLFY